MEEKREISTEQASEIEKRGIIYNTCKRMLSKHLSEEKSGNSRYIFAVDIESIAEALMAWGYSSILIRDKEEEDEIIKIIEESNQFSNNCIIIACCTKSVNERLEKSVKARFIKTGWQIYAKQSKEYYSLHSDDLKPIIEKYIEKIDKPVTEREKLKRNSETEDRGRFCVPKPKDAEPSPVPTEREKFERNPETGLIIIDRKCDCCRDIAQYIIKTYDVAYLDNELRYNTENRFYKLYTAEINRDCIINEVERTTSTFRKEIYEHIKSIAPHKKATKHIIAFKNCCYDYKNFKFLDFNEDMYLTRQIPHNFIPPTEADMELCNFFKSVACDDNEIYTLLFEIICYAFLDENPWQKHFFLYGTGGNGKGVYLEFLRFLFGEENYTTSNWTDLQTAQGRYGIEDKMLIICDDIDGTYIDVPQGLKNIAAGEIVTIRPLYENAYQYRVTAKLISSGNAIPKVKDTSNGWARRLVTIPFKGDFRENPDYDLVEKICTEKAAEYVIFTCLKHLKAMLTKTDTHQPGFYHSAAVDELKEEYLLDNNPVAQFLSKDNLGNLKFRGKENAMVLDTIYGVCYKNFCMENGYKPLSKLAFSKVAKAVGLKMTRSNGDIRLYYL